MFKSQLFCMPASGTAGISVEQTLGWQPARTVSNTLDDHIALSRRRGNSRRAQDAAGFRLRERERQQIAAQVHDDLGGIVTALKSCVDVALMRQKQGQPLPIELLTDAATLATACFAAIRKIGMDLRPTLLDQLGFWCGIDFQLRCLSTRSGITTALYVDARLEPLTLTEESERVLFRVISEAITNAAKHARASKLTVKLFENHGLLIARIEDDGIGCCDDADGNRHTAGATARECGAGRGLRGLRELSREIGGYLMLEGAAGAGCAVCLAIPIGHCYAD